MASTKKAPLSSIKRHRRQVRRQIILPVMLLVVLMAVFIAALVLPGSPIQLNGAGEFSIVANFVLVCFALLPTVLCLFIVYAMLVATVWFMNVSHNWSAKQLRQVQQVTRTTADKTAEYSDKLNKQSIEVNSRLAFLEPLLRLFDKPEKPDES